MNGRVRASSMVGYCVSSGFRKIPSYALRYTHCRVAAETATSRRPIISSYLGRYPWDSCSATAMSRDFSSRSVGKTFYFYPHILKTTENFLYHRDVAVFSQKNGQTFAGRDVVPFGRRTVRCFSASVSKVWRAFGVSLLMRRICECRYCFFL